MRSKALASLILTSATILAAAKPPAKEPQVAASTYALLRFETDQGKTCLASVVDAPTAVPTQVLKVSCDGTVVLKYISQDGLIDLSLNYPKSNLLMARWEGGSHVRMTIFSLRSDLVAKPVFDETLEFMPDVPSPDALLVYRDKRPADSLMIPSITDVYRWNGTRYAITQEWKWGPNMRFEDRFCVLDAQSLSCPATLIPLK